MGATLSVLVVDDSDLIRESLVRYLTHRGCEVAVATNGAEGLDALRHGRFDIVITDVQMPRRGGLWLWREALALRPELRGRFVLCSSEPLPQGGNGVSPASHERFLLKPSR
jgi:CheY-like chemotaxis protein